MEATSTVVIVKDLDILIRTLYFMGGIFLFLYTLRIFIKK